MAGYDAFISYSHDADGLLAPALQSGLQRLARPWRKRRALEVFRDRTGLAVTPHLWGEISVALADARWLILMASPDSAASKWVNQEIEFFLANDPTARDRILPVVTGGEWQWAGDGQFTAESTAVPAALRGVFEEEPLYLDLRWAKDRTDLSLHDVVFRAAVADVAAPVHGKSKDELIGEDVRQFRLARRLRRAAVISLAVLTIGALVASVIAVSKSREAVRQRNVAQANAAESRSRELAASALGLKGDDPAAAALLAVDSLYPNGATEMLRSPQSTDAVGITARALQSRLFVPSGSLPKSSGDAIVATVGNYVGMVGATEGGPPCWPYFENGVGLANPITWWDRSTGTRLDGAPPGVELPVSFIELSSGTFANNGVFRIDDALSVTPIIASPSCGARVGETYQEPSPYSMPATYDADRGLMVAFDKQQNEFVAVEATTGDVLSHMPSPPDVESPVWTSVALVGDTVMATSVDGFVRTWSLTAGGAATKTYDSTRVVGRGSTVFVEGHGALEASTGHPRSLLPEVFDYLGAIEISPDGRFLAMSDFSCGCSVGIWDLQEYYGGPIALIDASELTSLNWQGDELAVVSARGVRYYEYHDPHPLRGVDEMAISGDESTTVVEHGGRDIEVYDTGNLAGAAVRRIALSEQEYASLAVSPDGHLVAIAGDRFRVVDVGTGTEVFSKPTDSAAADFDPSGRFLAYWTNVYLDPGAPPPPKRQLEIYDTDSWQVVATALVAPARAGFRWTSPTELVGVSADGSLTILTLDGGTLTPTSRPVDVSVSSVWFSTDHSLLAAGDDNGSVTLARGLAENGTAVVPVSTIDAGTSPVGAVSFSPDGERMLTVSGTRILMWDISSRSDPRQIEDLGLLPTLVGAGNTDGLTIDVHFRADGRSLVVSKRGTVVELPDFDPAGVCAAVTEADLARAEAIMGNESACRRISFSS